MIQFSSNTQPPLRRQRSYSFWSGTWGRLCKNRLAIVGLVILTVLAVSALLADFVAPYHFDEQNLSARLQPPSVDHFFGTDSVGRDVFSRVIYGGRVSLQIGLVSVLISGTLGGTLGVLAGYFGGSTDNLIMRALDILLAVPDILLAISIATTLGPGLFNLMLAIGLSFIPHYARMVRASVLSIKEQKFIQAARAIGCNDFKIITSHLLPNIMAPVIVQTTLGIALAILTASSLSFIGLGIRPPIPEWGAMLATGRDYIRSHWHIVTFPGLAIFITILSFNLLGDGLRDALDPRLKR